MPGRLVHLLPTLLLVFLFDILMTHSFILRNLCLFCGVFVGRNGHFDTLLRLF